MGLCLNPWYRALVGEWRAHVVFSAVHFIFAKAGPVRVQA